MIKLYWPIQCHFILSNQPTQCLNHRPIQLNSRVLVPLAHTVSSYWPRPIHYYWKSVISWAHTMLLYLTNRPTQCNHTVIYWPIQSHRICHNQPMQYNHTVLQYIGRYNHIEYATIG